MPSADAVPSHLLEVAAAVVPHMDEDAARLVEGESHAVVLLPGAAAVRVARTPAAAAALRRRSALLDVLAGLGLPFDVPRPLGPVREVGSCAAVALCWVGGARPPPGQGDPAQVRGVLAALAGVDVGPLAALLDVPHAYAGGARWTELVGEEVIPRLPAHLHDEARRRVAQVLGLEEVTPGLVHGDLAGDNLRIDQHGRITGVLDWDLASAWDPAVDAACLAWFGWATVRAAVDRRTYERAVIRYGVFGLEQIAAAVLHGTEDQVDRAIAGIGRWFETGPPP